MRRCILYRVRIRKQSSNRKSKSFRLAFRRQEKFQILQLRCRTYHHRASSYPKNTYECDVNEPRTPGISVRWRRTRTASPWRCRGPDDIAWFGSIKAYKRRSSAPDSPLMWWKQIPPGKNKKQQRALNVHQSGQLVSMVCWLYSRPRLIIPHRSY